MKILIKNAKIIDSLSKHNNKTYDIVIDFAIFSILLLSIRIS